MKSPFLRATAILLGLMAASAAARADDVPGPTRTKEVVARELMEVTGSSKLAMQVMEQMITPLKQAVPDVPEDFWSRFMAEINPDELVAKVVPIYCEHYSLDELEQLLAFHKSPLGQKVIEETPAIMKQSMAAGQEWGRQVAKRAIRKAEEERAKPSTKS